MSLDLSDLSSGFSDVSKHLSDLYSDFFDLSVGLFHLSIGFSDLFLGHLLCLFKRKLLYVTFVRKCVGCLKRAK